MKKKKKKFTEINHKNQLLLSHNTTNTITNTTAQTQI